MNESISVRHILAPIELSDGSKSALRYVRFLARSSGARITLFYVPADDRDEGCQPDDEELRLLESAVREYADPFFQGLPYEVMIGSSDPAVAVPRTAREIGADLIIMGAFGRKGIDRAIAGSFVDPPAAPRAAATS